MGTASKVVSVLFRIGELICAAIVTGILGEYISVVDDAHFHVGSRIVYTISIAAISLFFSLALCPPFMYSFWAFPLDLALFVCWMVAFGLLVNLTGTHGCNSAWYWTNWEYYWGGWYRTVPISNATQSLIGTASCSYYRTGVAFSFIGGMIWLGSGLLGMYVISGRRRDRTVPNLETSETKAERENSGSEGGPAPNTFV